MKLFARDLRDLAMIFGVCLMLTIGIQTAISEFVPVVNTYENGVDDDDGPPIKSGPSSGGYDGYYNLIQPDGAAGPAAAALRSP